MRPVLSCRRALMLAVAALMAVVLASPGMAQSTGMCKGKVVDAKNQPIEGAKVTIEFKEGINRRYEVKTNKKGEFMQIGLQPGQYKVTAEKQGIGVQSLRRPRPPRRCRPRSTSSWCRARRSRRPRMRPSRWPSRRSSTRASRPRAGATTTWRSRSSSRR